MFRCQCSLSGLSCTFQNFLKATQLYDMKLGYVKAQSDEEAAKQHIEAKESVSSHSSAGSAFTVHCSSETAG